MFPFDISYWIVTEKDISYQTTMCGINTRQTHVWLWQLFNISTTMQYVVSGLLMLLCVWLLECPVAVAHLLHRDDNMTYLTTQVARFALQLRTQ